MENKEKEQYDKQKRFVKEFACKTLLNYYQVKLEKTEINRVEEYRNSIEEKVEELKKKMKTNGYYAENYYEVTLLINSLVGLLVFPQQLEFNKLKKMSDMDFELKMPTLYKYVTSNDENVYFNRYKVENGSKSRCLEDESGYLAGHIVRHLRNSLSHQNVMISPITSIYNVNKKDPITHIKFCDKPANSDKILFKLVVSVKNDYVDGKYENDLEKILEEICNVLIDL